MAAWMGHGLEIHRRVYLWWMLSARKKESMQRRRGGSFSFVVPSVVGAALPQGITPELIAMAMKLKAAGIA